MFGRTAFIFVLGLACIAGTATPALAGEYTQDCRLADVSCKGLFNDLVTAKFTKRFSHERFAIKVYTDTTKFDDGSGVSFAFAGVVPRSTGPNAYMPDRIWRVVTHHAKVGSAYERQEKSRAAARKAVENMMASCDDSPNCDVLR